MLHPHVEERISEGWSPISMVCYAPSMGYCYGCDPLAKEIIYALESQGFYIDIDPLAHIPSLEEIFFPIPGDITKEDRSLRELLLDRKAYDTSKGIIIPNRLQLYQKTR